MNETINKVVKFTEDIVNGKDFSKSEISAVLNLIDHSDHNLNVYKGILTIYYFSKFKEFPDASLEKLRTDDNFSKCLSLLNGDILPPSEVGGVFLNTLTISDSDEAYRDILMGCFYGALWPFMNNPRNFEIALDYGIAIIKSAFSLDNFDVRKKISFNKDKVKELEGIVQKALIPSN